MNKEQEMKQHIKDLRREQEKANKEHRFSDADYLDAEIHEAIESLVEYRRMR